MKIEIINKELKLDISGFSGVATNKNYAGTAFALMDKMWLVVKSKGLKHKGLNIWVYEAGEKVFAGVELEDHASTMPGWSKSQFCLPNMLTTNILARIAG